MNTKIFIPIVVIIISAIAIFLIPENSSMSSDTLYQYGFTFYDVEKIKESLSEKNIFMSTPTPVTDHTIKNYCAIRDEIYLVLTTVLQLLFKVQMGNLLEISIWVEAQIIR